MFRISQYMQLIAAFERGEQPPRTRGGAPTGPVVIWNLIRRCNLTCRHCYSISADTDFPNELSTDEVFRTMDALHAAGVRVLILSGGEPLLRPDIWPIADRAKAMGFYVGLSTNGTLIDAALADRVAAQGFDYVGISLDGIGATHDHFRRKEGAFDASLAAIRRLHGLGVKVGARYTMTEGNAQDFEPLLDLCEREGIDKFYFSHLNYAGRGNKNRKTDAQHATTRRAMQTLFARAWLDAQAGGTREYVTGNNDADGVFLLQWVHRHFPQHHAIVAERLVRWGGNSSGVNVANIDNLGVVHPDTMWWHYPLGNVKTRPFGEIWADTRDPLMAGLKQHPRPVTGRCGACAYLAICNGNTRTRAQQLTGDFWAEDPGCYLSDEEIGLEPVKGLAADCADARG